VTTYYNFNTLAGACPCYTNIAQCPQDASGPWCTVPPHVPALPAPVGTSSLLVVPNCVLKNQLGNYYYSVKATQQLTDLPIGYTIKPSLRTPNFTTIANLGVGYNRLTTLRGNVMEPNRYWHWAITVPAAVYTNNTVLVVNVSSVQSGSLRMLYNGPQQAFPAELWSGCYLRDFGVVAGSAVVQVEPCDFGVGTVYVSLRSISNQISMSYEFSVYVKQPINLPLGGTGLVNQQLWNMQWEQVCVCVWVGICLSLVSLSH
jgi:hypothetical protein